ncbi:hypothetical protein [Pseudomonas japonica]|uniref:hypothetical protein n=1 Tax=Pseudomonas japonica TaxID=256466 RepID=UPI003A8BD7A4
MSGLSDAFTLPPCSPSPPGRHGKARLIFIPECCGAGFSLHIATERRLIAETFPTVTEIAER